MGMAMRGLTHCEKCGKALNYDEYVLCKYCEKEENKKSKIELKKCKYCEEREDKTIKGEDFELLSTAGFKYDRIYKSWIMKNKLDEKAGIMIITDYTNGVYFDINYCPICGRKL